MRRVVLLLLALGFFACEDPSRAVDPAWGKQACAHCAMLLSDARFGAQLTTEAGDRFFFDDPGCMAAWARAHGRVRAMWVHEDGVWVDAKKARYERAASPMDYGFAPSQGGAFEWGTVEKAALDRGGSS